MDRDHAPVVGTLLLQDGSQSFTSDFAGANPQFRKALKPPVSSLVSLQRPTSSQINTDAIATIKIISGSEVIPRYCICKQPIMRCNIQDSKGRAKVKRMATGATIKIVTG